MHYQQSRVPFHHLLVLVTSHSRTTESTVYTLWHDERKFAGGPLRQTSSEPCPFAMNIEPRLLPTSAHHEAEVEKSVE